MSAWCEPVSEIESFICRQLQFTTACRVLSSDRRELGNYVDCASLWRSSRICLAPLTLPAVSRFLQSGQSDWILAKSCSNYNHTGKLKLVESFEQKIPFFQTWTVRSVQMPNAGFEDNQDLEASTRCFHILVIVVWNSMQRWKEKKNWQCWKQGDGKKEDSVKWKWAAKKEKLMLQHKNCMKNIVSLLDLSYVYGLVCI